MIATDTAHDFEPEGGGSPPRQRFPSLGGNGGPDGKEFGNLSRPAKPWVGLWVFLCVATVLFSISLSTYLARMSLLDWRPTPDPDLLWLNTALLAAASISMQAASNFAAAGRIKTFRYALFGAGATSVLFVTGQLMVWERLHADGYTLSSNPADGFFYLLTCLHGLHLIGGMVIWSRVWLRFQQGLDISAISRICAVYWHFLTTVWMVLFAVMLAT